MTRGDVIIRVPRGSNGKKHGVHERVGWDVGAMSLLCSLG